MYMAFSLNIRGFVKYTRAGGILIEAEGEEKQLGQFIAWLRNFVQSWKISDFSIVETTPKGYSSFEIRNSPCVDDTPEHKSFSIKYLAIFWMRIRRLVGLEK
jgi:acylphosphatase